MKIIIILLTLSWSSVVLASQSGLFTKPQQKVVLGAIDTNCFHGWCTGDLDANFTNFGCFKTLDQTYTCQLDFKFIETVKMPRGKSSYTPYDMPADYFKNASSNGVKVFSEDEKRIYHYASCVFKGISKASDLVTLITDKRYPAGYKYDVTEQFGYDNLYCLSAARLLL